MQFQKFESTESTLDWFHFSGESVLKLKTESESNRIRTNQTSKFQRNQNQNKLLKHTAKFERPKLDSWNND